MANRERERIFAGQTIGGDSVAGTFSIEFTVHSADGLRLRTLTSLVNTRRLYSIIPAQILTELGIQREHYQRFRRADDFVRQLGIGLVKMELQNETGLTHVVFGDDLAETVIGSMTLASFAVAADPEQQRLVPGLLTLYQGKLYAPVP